MANQIDANGLQTNTLQEVIDLLTTGFQTIYGADINTDSDSPDGQMINLIAQAAIDNLDLLTAIYNQFDPDQAIGRTLDERCAINGVARLGGTFTITNIDITTTSACTLAGLDAEIDNPDGTGYTVSDNAGNQWILTSTEVIAGAGTYTLAFRSKVNGAVLTTPNTITTPVTIVLGVSAINNPTTYTTLGINEETDAQLRIRRQKSVSLSSKGYLAGLLAALQNINGVTSAYVYENVTGATDGDGVPSHSIWVIVAGGADADIAQAIYSKRNAGCGMKGSETYNILQVDGSYFVVKFDRTAAENLYIEFDATSINGVDTIDDTYIKAQLVTLFAPGVNETIDINHIATIVQGIDPNCLVTNCFIGLTVSPSDTILSPSAKNKYLAVSGSRIAITVL